MHKWLLGNSGLKTLVDSIHNTDHLSSSYKDPSQLSSVAQQLDGFLPTATDDARAYISQLEDKMLTRRVVQADETRMAQVNGDMEDEVLLRDVFPRTSDEIRVLLS